MISCAAIQKLERYGQLAQKRRGVEDFVRSSLKDPRRGNVYALTHMPTWQACLQALTAHKTIHNHKEKDNNYNNKEKEGGWSGNDNIALDSPAQTVCISDSLLYAVSFATALVVHHMDEQRYTKHKHQQVMKEGDEDALQGKVFLTRLVEASELLSLLHGVAEACGRLANRWSDGSCVMTQALGHLLSTASDAVLVSTMLRHADTNDTEKEGEMLHEICRSSTALLGAVARQLRTAQTRHPLNTLHNVRPCSTLLHELLRKSKAAGGTTAAARGDKAGAVSTTLRSTVEQQLLNEDAIVTGRLLAWAAVVGCASLIASLSTFSAFQKLSLIDAVVGESPASCCYVEIGVFRRALASLFSSAACNRVTRLVVYFRGDDIKLMQNNVREVSEYAMHTHVTTPPLEEATLRSVAQLSEPQQQQHAALLLAQWMASIALFYRSFCVEQSWTAFAKEQRRMMLLQERQSRQLRRAQRQHGISVGSRGSSHGSSSHAEMSLSSGVNNENDPITQNDDSGDAELRSVLSYGSKISIASRASMISSLSKPSVASYRAFLSVIDATRKGVDGNEVTDMVAYAHQSEDNNSNLPLILLEEVALALERFVETAGNVGLGDTLLDTFDLRALAWRTIGELYAFIQSTIVSVAVPSPSLPPCSAAAASEGVPPVFHFGNDIRYNKGLGYEVLGLLFSKVVLPQLLATHLGSLAARQSIERALTRCLSAYEVIAPQVIDHNVPAILRVTAHVAISEASLGHQGSAGDGGVDAASDTPTTMLHEFLINVVTRFGKSNQLSLLLDAIVAHLRAGNGGIRGAGKLREEEVELEVASKAALHQVFAHPQVRAALLEASGIALDPENLLLHLLTYVSRWASEDEDVDDTGAEREAWVASVRAKISDFLPQDALFLLDVVVTVVEGVLATSITATALLERAAELELTLSTFLVNRLHSAFFLESEEKIDEDERRSPHDARMKEGRKGEEVKEKKAASFRLFQDDIVVKPRMQRRLMLYTLHAIYQARELICTCLQDLGVQNVEGYLQMLEVTMWHLQTRVGEVVGSLTIDDLDATMSSTTRMRQAPFVHRAILLPQLALQRLTLARSVSVALNVVVGPARDAKRLTSFVLSHMRFVSEGGYIPDGEPARALQLANQLTEEEWCCIVRFGSSKKVRQALVWLLQASFTASPAAWKSSQWISNCLNTAAGFLLEALCDVFMGITDDEARSYFCRRLGSSSNNGENGNDKQEGSEEAPLLQLCAALSDVLHRIGHIPQWPSLLQRCVHWLLLLFPSFSSDPQVPEQQESHSTLLLQRLVQLVMDFLSCEDGVQLLFRRVLLDGAQHQHHHPTQLCARRKRGREQKVVNEAFLQTIGVSDISLETVVHATSRVPGDDNKKNNGDHSKKVDEEEEDDDDDEGGYKEDELLRRRAVVYDTVVRQIFSEEFAVFLVRHSRRGGAMTTTGIRASKILKQLYTMALTVCRSMGTGRNGVAPAHNFALAVVEAMRNCCCRCDGGNFTALSSFLDEMGAKTVAVVCATRHPESTEEKATKKRSRREVADEQYGEGKETLQQKPEEGIDNNNKCDTSNSQKNGEKETLSSEQQGAGDEMQVHEVSLRWMDLLGTLFLEVLQNLIDGVKMREPLLDAFTALYMSLERARGCPNGRMIPALGVSATLAGNQKGRRQREQAARSLAAATIALPCLSDAVGFLSQLFSPVDVESKQKSLVTLVQLLTLRSDSALRTLWVLFIAYGELRSLLRGNTNAEGNSRFCWLSAVLSSFDPREDYSTSNDNNGEAHQWQERFFSAVVENKRRPMSGFTFFALQQEPVYFNDAATEWLVRQLHGMPSILLAFSAESAPGLLQEYMRALLRVAVPPTSPPSSCSHLERHQQLLLAASVSLHRLSKVPHMRFSMWRRDVKRLLSASGSTSLLLVRGARTLWCRVLELCALPLPALHNDESFVDHELYFLQALLCETRDYVSSDHGEGEEQVLLRVLHLLARTLLPLDVLWKRPHILPALLSSLLVRCLNGVSRGSCSRVLLNQLSSFLFQLVKDAGSNSNGHASSSVKALCLASITSCLFQHSAAYIDVFTTHSGDLDFLAADLLKALQRVHLLPRRSPSALLVQKGDNVWSDATLCDLTYACVGEDDGQSLLRQAAERVEEDEGYGDRRIFMVTK